MKARIINGEEFGGIHQDIWLTNNQDIIFAGQLVSEWVLTEKLPSDSIIIPKWDGEIWYESQTSSDILAKKTQQAIEIDLEYTALISNLMRKYIEKYIIDGVPVPQTAIDQRDALRLECNNKILALGINDFTYRQTVKGL